MLQFPCMRFDRCAVHVLADCSACDRCLGCSTCSSVTFPTSRMATPAPMASTVPLATPVAPPEARESDAFAMLLLESTGGSATQSNSRESTASLSNEEQPQISRTSGLLEIPGACGRASTYLNPARGPKSLACHLQRRGLAVSSSQILRHRGESPQRHLGAQPGQLAATDTLCRSIRCMISACH